MAEQVETHQGHIREEPDTVSGAAPKPDAQSDQVLWTKFAEASTVEAFCQHWLALECRMMQGVRAGMVLLGPADSGPFRPVATWPVGRRNLKHLTKTAERTLSERRGLVSRGETGQAGQAETLETARYFEIGYPVEVRGALHGAVVLEILPDTDLSLQSSMRQLHWGAAWLELLFSREAIASEAAMRGRIQTALDIVATTVGHDRFYAAAMALVTTLATKLECDRVSLGFIKRGRTRVAAMSHSADFKQQANLVRSIAAAMDEAIDQRETIIYPVAADGPGVVAHAHAEFAEEHGAGTVCTLPLESGGMVVGALLLERPSERPFDGQARDLCKSIAAVVGPMLEIHRREDRWLMAKAWGSLTHTVKDVFGPSHVALKLGASAVAGLFAFCLFATGDYRVAAKTVIEPIIQRAAAAPFDGYIREAPARAGDLVISGQVLCTLDERELKLERLKALSKLEEYQKEYHKAMAEREAAKAEILTAQMHQAQSEVALLDDQLAHTRVVAPFDGIVVTGDLSQSLGSPVEKGKVLYEVAPLDHYRIVLEVDERDIADVQVGQRGQLLLSAFPTETIDLAVEKVTPVSTAREGRNFFRVEAALDRPHARLQPGMEGAGKIEVDRRRLVWIWTHQVIDWIRLAVWSWMP